FSSYGPSSDGQVKPTVASVGAGTAIIAPNNFQTFGNGTSFATPNMAGLVTCLWQAFPEFTNMEIIEAVKKSSSIFSAPDNRIGYGIPNFHTAFDDLTRQRALRNVTVLGNDWIRVYPNPFNGNFSALIKPLHTGTATFKLFDAGGKLYYTKQIAIVTDQLQTISFSNQPLSRGMYILKYDDGSTKRSIKLMRD
ncbi:MAG: S8 family peptidase, partial [Chitinophagaceae bacterium]|nr:S8 family peptidase [Chitinophagaceae bacterium]